MRAATTMPALVLVASLLQIVTGQQFDTSGDSSGSGFISMIDNTSTIRSICSEETTHVVASDICAATWNGTHSSVNRSQCEAMGCCNWVGLRDHPCEHDGTALNDVGAFFIFLFCMSCVPFTTYQVLRRLRWRGECLSQRSLPHAENFIGALDFNGSTVCCIP